MLNALRRDLLSRRPMPIRWSISQPQTDEHRVWVQCSHLTVSVSLWVLPLEPTESAAQLLGAVSFVPAPVGHDHLLGLPGEHPFEGGAGLAFAAQEGKPEINRRLPIRVRRTREAHQPSVGATYLLRLEVLEQVREDQSTCLAVKEDDLLHKSAAPEDKLNEVLAPHRVGLVAQF